MTDRELLEMAAKAAGLTYRDDLWNAGHVQNEFGSWNAWNPLTDDGDALRLAVKLGFSRILITKVGTCSVETTDQLDQNPAIVVEFCKEGDCHFAVTRRAIVRAAAEIGKAIP